MNTPMVTMWQGRDVRTLTRAELLDVVQWLMAESRHYREECTRMRRHVDWVAYLMEERAPVIPDEERRP
jgi:hypothetical protein